MEIKVDASQLTILTRFFDGLSKSDQGKVFMAAYKRAAKPLIEAARSTVPIHNGNLYRSLGSITDPKNVSILVGARLAGRTDSKGWHGHFTENGTVERFKRRQSMRAGSKNRGGSAGASTGRVVAQHWFERAYNATEKKVFDSIADEWYNEIDRVIQRTVKKARKR